MELFKLEALFPVEFAKLKKLALLPAGHNDWGGVRMSSVHQAPKLPSARFHSNAYQKKDFYKLVSRMI